MSDCPKTTEPFPQPQRRDDLPPCGECHLQPGETCDICGAVRVEQAVLQRIAARWVRESGRSPSDYAWFLGNWRSLAGLKSYLMAQPEMQS